MDEIRPDGGSTTLFGDKMKPNPLLLLPGCWIAVTLPIAFMIGGDSQTPLQSVASFILFSYVFAVPAAIVCSFIGVKLAFQHGTIETWQKVSFLLHCAILCVAGYFCFVIVTFPRIGPH